MGWPIFKKNLGFNYGSSSVGSCLECELDRPAPRAPRLTFLGLNYFSRLMKSDSLFGILTPI